MLDLILALPLALEGFNTLILVICKFFKHITLIKGMDTYSVKEWAHIFFKHLNLVDSSFLGNLITNHDPKFLSKFWTALFIKLEVKLLYSITYYPQMDGSSKRKNQTIEIILRFFVYILKHPSYWHKLYLGFSLYLIIHRF